ncbi:hypothetical protein PMZ80_009516 [Knufia obscura]|uniref:Allergen n=2 Tax=Knufia TaxID=430999 RepID=A0AAN8EH88_9EURO|nr:hypothetical protein PMZ80_009516 [Knufia obscura]KAK5949545.1 hypothetical protein OHC33_009352 [Knufia fluminis]
MEAAKNFVAQHTARTGHFTDVEEVVRPAVTWEHVYPTRDEVVTEAVDREVHLDHYHTTVQPLSHHETLPTKHTHNLLPAKEARFEHDDVEATKRLAADLAAHFKDTLVVEPTTHSTAQLPTVVGEHWHHHVHEVVQPIIYKETIQEEVVHTTIPIHEVHHNRAEHHTMSQLPVKSMEEFQATAHRAPQHETYDGVPRPYNEKLATTIEKLGLGHTITPPRAVPTSITTTSTTTNTNTNVSHEPRTPVNQRFRRNSSVSSSSSASSTRDPMTPKTPRSPVFRSRHEKMPSNGATQPVKVVGADGADMSPRSSNESTGRRGFLGRLSGRA